MHNVKKQILESAKLQFLQYGYKKTNLDDIVRDVRISKGTIYNYFKNKEDLFKCVTNSNFDEMNVHLESILDTEPNIQKKIPLYICKKVEFMQNLFIQHKSNPHIISELREMYDLFQIESSNEHELIKKILKLGVKKQILRKCNYKATSTVSLK